MMNRFFNIILYLSLDYIICDDKQQLNERQYGEYCGYESCQRVKAGVLNVHIVPSTHFEIGREKSFHSYFTGEHDKDGISEDLNYRKSVIHAKKAMDSIVAELWANPARKFALSDLSYFFRWWKFRSGVVKRMVHALVRQGRLVFVGGGWTVNDESVTNYQSIIDSYTYGLRKLNDTFGDCGRPIVAWQSDVFGHSREMTNLFASMGYDGLFINPISFDDEINRMKSKSLEMLWRGSDDLGVYSDIFTHKLFDGFWNPPGFCFDNVCRDDDSIVDSDDTITNVQEKVKDFVRVTTIRQAPYYRTKNIMIIMGTRNSYYDARRWFRNIDRLIKHVRNSAINYGAEINLFYSTPFCYLRAIYNANPVLPTKQDDFFPLAMEEQNYFTGIYSSRPTLKYMERIGNIYLQMAKQIELTAGLQSNNLILEEIKWIMAIMQDHNALTGAHKQCVSNYYAQKLFVATQKAVNIMRQGFNKIRGTPQTTLYYRCPFNMSECHNTIGERQYVVVYNPLGWHVTVPVRIPTVYTNYTVMDSVGNIIEANILPVPHAVDNIPERNTVANLELVFIAKKLPPIGFRCYYIEIMQENVRVPKAAWIIKNKLAKHKKHQLFLGKSINGTRHNNRVEKKIIYSNHSLMEKREDSLNYIDDIDNQSNIIYTNLPVEQQNIDVVTPTQTTTEDYLTETTTEAPEADTEDVITTVTEDSITTLTDNVKTTITDDSITTVPTAATENATVIKKDQTVNNDENISNANEALLSLNNIYESNDITNSSVDFDYEFDNQNIFGPTFAYISEQLFIQNKFIRVNLDRTAKWIANVVLTNGIDISFDIQFYYYEAYAHKFQHTKKSHQRSSGAYIFKPTSQMPIHIAEDVKTRVYKSNIVEELHVSTSDVTFFVIRLYNETPYIEVDWIVGPIPVDDGIGKEIIIKYKTNLDNKRTFFTDSNGRQTIKRRVNERGSYKYEKILPTTGNYYPVTSKIYIEDLEQNIRFAVLIDRPQGGSSLNNGELELMLHRRLVTDDSNMKIYLNETFGSSGITVRGKHYIYISKADKLHSRIFEKKLAKEIQLYPQILVSKRNVDMDLTRFLNVKNQFSAIKQKLPVGIHILTLEPLENNKLLLRLENYLEKCDIGKMKTKKVFINKLFKHFKIKDVKETLLGGNILREELNPLQWRTESNFVENFNDFYGSKQNPQYVDNEVVNDDKIVDWKEGVSLKPMEIRTFIVIFRYIKTY